MRNVQKTKFIKTVSIIALASLYSNVSNAWFWQESNDRRMRIDAMGQEVPAIEESWLDKMTTYHTELKPEYDPITQRVVMPNGAPTYDGIHHNVGSVTVKPAWYDRATTYHEEQRRPWNPYSAETKEFPAYMYYDKVEAERANEHYLQKGLKPVPYMYGSASLVLRKDRAVEDFNFVEGENLDGLSETEVAVNADGSTDARMVGMEGVYIRPAGGYDSIESRDGQNQLAANRSGNIMLADPVGGFESIEVAEMQGGNANMAGTNSYNNITIGSPKKFDVQASTKIGNPKSDWRDKLNVKPNLARPGDFDYKKKAETRVAAGSSADQYGHVPGSQSYYQSAGQFGETVNYNGGQVIAGTGDFVEDYTNTGEKVNSYTVESGDTLSQISDKEKVYGDWTLWPLIYDANRSQVNDPDLIEPGQNLDIPRDYADEQAYDARHRARNKEVPISFTDGR